MKTEFLSGSVAMYRKRGNDFKSKENRFRLARWKKGFTIVKQWNGLPGAVVDAPSWNIQGQARWGSELSNPVEGVCALPREVGLYNM